MLDLTSGVPGGQPTTGQSGEGSLAHPSERRMAMSKAQDVKKDTKKKPQKTLKEKREEKKNKDKAK